MERVKWVFDLSHGKFMIPKARQGLSGVMKKSNNCVNLTFISNSISNFIKFLL